MGVRASSSRSPRYTGGRRFSALGLRDAKQGVWDVTAEFETPPRTPRLGARSPKAREFGLRPRHSGTRDAASESEPWQGGVRDLALGIRALHRGVRETGIMMTERWWETVQRMVSYEGNSDQGVEDIGEVGPLIAQRHRRWADMYPITGALYVHSTEEPPTPRSLLRQQRSAKKHESLP